MKFAALLSSLLILNSPLIPFSGEYEETVSVLGRRHVYSAKNFKELIKVRNGDDEFYIVTEERFDDCLEDYGRTIEIHWNGLVFYSSDYSFYYASPPNNYKLKINFEKTK